MSNYVIHNGELYHFGVKGMKWGVRRKRPQVSGAARVGGRAKVSGHTRVGSGSKIRELASNPKVRKGAKIAAGILVGAVGAAAIGYGGYIAAPHVKRLAASGAAYASKALAAYNTSHTVHKSVKRMASTINTARSMTGNIDSRLLGGMSPTEYKRFERLMG